MGKHVSLAIVALAFLPTGGGRAAGLPSGGTVLVALKLDGPADDAATRTFMDAATEALAAKGFTILDDPDHAAYQADVTVRREDVGTGRGRATGGSTVIMPGGSGGPGVTIPLSTGRSSLVTMQRTTLGVRIRRRGEDRVAWHGAAVTVRTLDGRDGADQRVAADLSAAVLGPYPAELPGVIGLP